MRFSGFRRSPVARVKSGWWIYLADLGATPLAGSPADFGTLISEEIEKWRKVIKFAGITSE